MCYPVFVFSRTRVVYFFGLLLLIYIVIVVIPGTETIRHTLDTHTGTHQPKTQTHTVYTHLKGLNICWFNMQRLKHFKQERRRDSHPATRFKGLKGEE